MLLAGLSDRDFVLSEILPVDRGYLRLPVGPAPKRHAPDSKAAGCLREAVLFKIGGERHDVIVTGDTISRNRALTGSVTSGTLYS